ncbi:ubiquitin-protein ligase E3A [Exaiptasia diaphana]|uniref:Ubiquitin-protein ligase E3A n=1 Tax=Exaiptasia diaphana TaxID=2652724 RepID=A0A913XPJ6_EXADI|nr:ubiquitin-protein ligase E3A [Exaiptasia diaphana]XP_020907653.1 ubiquitin-protein ligase E3A [Exaiptasia diaphana]KXJ10271.1 Ubiquitin-protein ligase E3A [Exaiptasia diaphana]
MDNMKRATAEQLIKNYFYQLTNGCGMTDCNNENCASNGRLKLSSNDAAALALKLFHEKAQLCIHRGCFFTETLLLSTIKSCKDVGSYKELVHSIGKVFSDPKSLNKSFLLSEPKKLDGATLFVDVEAMKRIYAALYEIGDSSIENALINSVETLSTAVEMELLYKNPNCKDPQYLNQFILIFVNSMLQSPEYLERALPRFLKALCQLPVSAQAQLVRIWCTFPVEDIRHMVETLQQLITYRVLTGPSAVDHVPVHDDDVIVNSAKTMKLLYFVSIIEGHKRNPVELSDHQNDTMDSVAANTSFFQDPLVRELKLKSSDCHQPLLSYDEFVNEPLNDQIEVDRDYTHFKSDHQHKFSFLNHTFLLSTATKGLGLFYDNRVRMYSERRLTMLYSLVHGHQHAPFLRLKVRRDNLIGDALVRLEMSAQDNPLDLKKQLVVEFEGEQGIDEGGVSKEFFQLVVEEIFNPDYGMFTYDPESRICWFNPTSFESDAQFRLIGLVVGLAIYNNIILDIHFPMVVYRKLFGKNGMFKDLADSHPSLYKSLKNMLEYPGNVKEDFMCTFKIGYTDVFGSSLSHDLKENGGDIPVTNENKVEYVNLYADFILNKSIEKQFNAFKTGFDMVVGDSPLMTFFRPDEVELLVCGSKELDFEALESATDYDGGLTKDSPLIKWFWEIVHNFTLEQKRQLLMFTTGSDRVPVGGLSKVKLIIAKNGSDSLRLPTAHTCFNVLLLPEYSSKEKLEERLLKAINNAKGFGLL